MKHEKDNQSLHIPYASRQDMILYAALGVLNISLVAIICEFASGLQPVFAALIGGLLYLAEVAVIGIRRIAKSRIYPTKSIHGLLGEEGSVVFKNSRSPIIIFDFHGTVLWYNDALRAVLDPYTNYIGQKISDVLSFNVEDVEAGDCKVTVENSVYGVEGFVVSKKNNGLAPAQIISLTHIATQSIPTVSCLSIKNASFSFVPTPSVPLTKTGFVIPVRSNSKRPPKPPTSEQTPSVTVRFICCFISSTAL